MNHKTRLFVAACVLIVAQFAVAASPDDNVALVQGFIDAVNSNDLTNLPNYVAEDFVRHSQASPGVVVTSREQFEQVIGSDREVFPDAQHEISQIVANENTVAVWGQYTGTAAVPSVGNAAPSRRIAVDFGAFFRIEGDKIREMWVTWDNKAVASQLEQ